jgi:hypothetical protein
LAASRSRCNNASVYSHVGAPWLTAYVSSKFAVRGFSEALRQELGDLPDVHVCTVSPSPIDSPIFASAASYSGWAVKAPPPTYPPEQVASAILASALHPKRERIVGGPGRLVIVGEAVAPRRFERVNRRYIDGLQFAAEPARPPMATCTHPSMTAALRPAAAGGADPTRRPSSAGWPRSDYWPPAHSPSHDRHPHQPDLTAEQPQFCHRWVRVHCCAART